MDDQDGPRRLWKRPVFWVFIGLAVVAAARSVWVSRHDENPLTDGLSLVGIALATVALVIVITLPIVTTLRRRTRRDLSELYAGALQFDAFLGERHLAARKQRAALVRDGNDIVPSASQFARIAVDDVGIRIVGAGWGSAALIAAEEIAEVRLGIETSGLFEYNAIVLHLVFDAQAIDLPFAPFRDGRLRPMDREDTASLAGRVRLDLRLESASTVDGDAA